jgi:hypothetical protein
VLQRLPILLALSVSLSACGLGGGDDEPTGNAPPNTQAPPVLGQPAGEENAAEALGFPGFATKNTTRVGGADPVADAAGVARAVFPGATAQTRPQAVVIVDVDDWRSAISATQLMSEPLRAPILFSVDGELPEASEDALDALKPTGAGKAGNAQVIRIGKDAATPEGLRSTDVAGSDFNLLARAIDRLQTSAAGKASEAVIVAPSDRPAFAMVAAGLAARTGAPVLWSGADRLPTATRQALQSRTQPSIYVLGPPEAISQAVAKQLGDLGAVTRVSGADPVRNAIEVARFADGRFGWNVVDPGHGLVFASSERPADAAAAAPLSTTGKYGPLLLVADAKALPRPLESYLLDIQPGYDRDPVRGVYNHGWLIGDDSAISVEVQAQIDSLLEIKSVDAPSE